MEDFFDLAGLFGNHTDFKNNPDPDENSQSCINSLPLTMAYVPIQKYSTQYGTEEALCSGTLFKDLNKPFYGCGSVGELQ